MEIGARPTASATSGFAISTSNENYRKRWFQILPQSFEPARAPHFACALLCVHHIPERPVCRPSRFFFSQPNSKLIFRFELQMTLNPPINIALGPPSVLQPLEPAHFIRLARAT
jgi:hypothetical protein